MMPRIKTVAMVLLAVAVLALVALRLNNRRAGRGKRRPDQALTFAPDTPARLLHVVDGDTAYFTLKDNRWVKGRLAGINTPECEKKQVRLKGGRRSARCHKDDELFGLEAYRVLLRLLRSGRITLGCQRKADGSCRRGRHGRVLTTISVDGKDVAEQLVAAGVALTYTKYPSPDRARLCRAELAARRQKVGMWGKGTVPEVMAMMGPRTRKWYALHDRRCRKAIGSRKR